MNRRCAAAGTALALLGAGGAAGCGSTAPAAHPGARGVRTATANQDPRGAAGRPTASASERPPVVHVSARVRDQEASMHRRVTRSLRAADHSRARYGTIPRDMRGRQAAPPDRVLSARAAHPAEAIQGDAVALHLAHGSARATVVGPFVPLRDRGSFHRHTSATWRVTFADVRGTVLLGRSRFTISDEQGRALSPRAWVRGGGPVPTTAPAGRSLTIVLAARTSIGDGVVRYAPAGGHWIAEWDFDAETD